MLAVLWLEQIAGIAASRETAWGILRQASGGRCLTSWSGRTPAAQLSFTMTAPAPHRTAMTQGEKMPSIGALGFTATIRHLSRLRLGVEMACCSPERTPH